LWNWPARPEPRFLIDQTDQGHTPCRGLMALFCLKIMSDSLKTCPQCDSPYAYPTDNGHYVCSECNHEWNAEAAAAGPVVKDANGAVLQNGDTVVIVKDLPVKGFQKAIKAGTKVKNIRLTDGDHNIDCKIDGFGSMALKSEFVKKG
jgi:protein PhnA